MPVGKIFPPSRELIAVDFPLLVRPKNATFLKEYFACDNNNNKIIIIIKTILMKEYFARDNLSPHTFMWSLVRTSLMPATF